MSSGYKADDGKQKKGRNPSRKQTALPMKDASLRDNVEIEKDSAVGAAPDVSKEISNPVAESVKQSSLSGTTGKSMPLLEKEGSGNVTGEHDKEGSGNVTGEHGKEGSGNVTGEHGKEYVKPLNKNLAACTAVRRRIISHIWADLEKLNNSAMAGADALADCAMTGVKELATSCMAKVDEFASCATSRIEQAGAGDDGDSGPAGDAEGGDKGDTAGGEGDTAGGDEEHPGFGSERKQRAPKILPVELIEGMDNPLIAKLFSVQLIEYVLEKMSLKWCNGEKTLKLFADAVPKRFTNVIGEAIFDIIHSRIEIVVNIYKMQVKLNICDINSFRRESCIAASLVFNTGYSHTSFLSFAAGLAGCSALHSATGNNEIADASAQLLAHILNHYIYMCVFYPTYSWFEMHETAINIRKGIEKKKKFNIFYPLIQMYEVEEIERLHGFTY